MMKVSTMAVLAVMVVLIIGGTVLITIRDTDDLNFSDEDLDEVDLYGGVVRYVKDGEDRVYEVMRSDSVEVADGLLKVTYKAMCDGEYRTFTGLSIPVEDVKGLIPTY